MKIQPGLLHSSVSGSAEPQRYLQWAREENSHSPHSYTFKADQIPMEQARETLAMMCPLLLLRLAGLSLPCPMADADITACKRPGAPDLLTWNPPGAAVIIK